MAQKKYYSLVVEGNEASVYIFGDITSWEWLDSDVSSFTLAKELEGLEADVINVFINSYGGEVAEGLAIYNQLKRHKAKVRTYCEGFACSAASVVFMAGDERVMSAASLLMIHDAWTWGSGNADDFRKLAKDLDTITQASVNAYMLHVNLDEAALKALMDEETWIAPADALAWGFATLVENEVTSNGINQSYKHKVVKQLLGSKDTDSKDTLTLRVDAEDLKELAGMFATHSDRLKLFEERLDKLAPQNVAEPSAEPPPADPVAKPEQNTPKHLMAALFAATRKG